MDKNKNVDSQVKKTITTVELKEKLKNRLEKQSTKEQKLKSEDNLILNQENDILNDMVESDESVFNYKTDPLEELDIEELMKKYLPESDLKYAHPIDIELNKDESADINIVGENIKPLNTSETDEAQTSNKADEAVIDDLIGQAGIVRKHQITDESEYYSNGKVSDEYVGDDNIYDEPEEVNKTLLNDLKNNEEIIENDILNIQNKRELSNQNKKNNKSEIRISENQPQEPVKDGSVETKQQIPAFDIKSIQEEQLGLFTQRKEITDLKRGRKNIDIKKHGADGKTNEGANLPDTGLIPNKPHDENEIDDTDVKLMMAFGMEDELAKTVGFDKVSEVEEKLDRKSINYKEAEGITTKEKKIIEFTSVSQTKEIITKFKSNYTAVLIRLLISFIILVVAFFYENIQVFGGSLPASVDMTIFPVVNIMLDLQLLLIGGALIYRQVIEGTISLLKLKAIPESIVAVLIIISVFYKLIACFSPSETGLRMYSFPVLLCVLLILIYEFLNLKREIYSFNIVASKRAKFAILKLPYEDADLETEAFKQLLPESPHIFKINKTMFVDGFFTRMNKVPKNSILFNIIIFLLLTVSVILFVLGYVFNGNIFSSISLAYITLLISMPFSVFITYSYPFYKASKEAYNIDSAIIGESSLIEYSDANAISFDDKDVFPSYGVKVKSVKVYGENRIDYIIYNAASLFLKTGGPLADVFDIATRDLGHSDNVDIIKVDTNGIEAVIEGAHIFVGRAAYIRSKGFYPKSEPDENENDAAGDNSVMYMTLNEELAAKMYVQYVIDPDFEFVIKQLHKIGICVGIKTFDPNIDDLMLSTKIKISKYPVKILKCKTTADVNEVSERLDSGIISKSSAKALLQTLALCDKVVNVTKNNIMVKIFSIIISLILSVIILILGMSTSIPSVYIALYQIFWMIPMIIITRIFIGRL
ncbi:MAG: hypothetical protein ACYCWE_09970 [Eubacteriales bacterium]